MKLRREMRLGLSALVVLQILLSMLAISLLTRMGPAVERILRENVYSVEAVEDMASILATHRGGAVPPAFDAALTRARENVTEAEEEPLLSALEQDAAPAFEGNPQARERVISALRELGNINRESMYRADEDAQELGLAGAWAAATLGAISLALGVVIFRRLRSRLEIPLTEIHRTVQAVRRGNGQARCARLEGPTELEQVGEDLNWLLDRRPARDVESNKATERDVILRRALLRLASQQGHRLMIVDDDDGLVLGSTEDYEAWKQDEGTWTQERLEGTSVRVMATDAKD